MDTTGRRRLQPFAIAIFISAFLLFQVQLLLAKYILPWFGGTASVWTATLLFFQTLLLAGYAYAHWLARRPAPIQWRLHLALLIASIALSAVLAHAWGVPLLPDNSWKPDGGGEPLWQVLMLLAAGVGLPFFVLSATNPLLAAWWTRAHVGSSPYRLYALSNLGSLLGLVSYPLLVEVFVPLGTQAWAWAGGYAAFAAAIAWSARAAGPVAVATVTAEATAPAPAITVRLLWFALAACASILLLAVTNRMTQEIAAVPFLWMLPLALYLLSFILCFDGDRRYNRRIYAPALALMLALAALLLHHGLKTAIVAQLALYALTLFVACMALHGELARLKPEARHVTGYYLTITAGGAAGGLFVGIAAPQLFPGFWELPLGLWLCAALYTWSLWREHASPLVHASTPATAGVLFGALLLVGFVISERLIGATWPLHLRNVLPLALLTGAGLVLLLALRPAGGLVLAGIGRGAGSGTPSAVSRRHNRGFLVAALLLYSAVLAMTVNELFSGVIDSERNFYGVVAVVEPNVEEPDLRLRQLTHGSTLHGMQMLTDPLHLVPGGYYGLNSGVGLTLRDYPRDAGELHMGVIGLGVGSLAAWGRDGDRIRFYEINPAVVAMAQGPRAAFSYLADSAAIVEVVPGDARLALERELAETGGHGFEVLVVDAFSSDSIPVHLLTREAVALYLVHLDPDRGVLALNISSRYVELKPLAARLARHFGLELAIVDSFGKTAAHEWASDWALLARPGMLARLPGVRQAAEPAPEPATRLWTDDYSNLLGALRLSAAPLPTPGQAGGRASGTGILDFLDRFDGER